jgi:hypothetical protein
LLSPPTCKEYTTVMRNRLRMPESSSATDRSHWQTIETQLFVSDCFRKLPRLLAKEPIKVPSGKYEETLRVERTQQDLINEMAMELSSLPRFTANAKVIEERDKTQLVHKQQIQTLPMPPVQQSIATIEPRLLAASHQLCKERDAIEDEIRQRQDRWRNRQPPPRQPPPSEEPPTEITA